MNDIGKEVRRLRGEKGWSQAELAVYSESSQPTVNQIESGKRNPSTRTLEKLAQALGVEVAELFPKKAQAPLPFESEEEQWRLLGYVRPWILLLDNHSEGWEKAAKEGTFSLGAFVEFEEAAQNIAEAVHSMSEGLKRHQGLDPMAGPIGFRLRESLLRAASTGRTAAQAALQIYGADELRKARTAKKRREAAATFEGIAGELTEKAAS